MNGLIEWILSFLYSIIYVQSYYPSIILYTLVYNISFLSVDHVPIIYLFNIIIINSCNCNNNNNKQYIYITSPIRPSSLQKKEKNLRINIKVITE